MNDLDRSTTWQMGFNTDKGYVRHKDDASQEIQSGGSIYVTNRLTSGLFNSLYHMILLKFTEENVNNQTLTQVSQVYVHVFFCIKVILSWLTIYAHWW